MRLAILIVGGLAIGAISVGGVRTFVPPNAQMFQAVRALGGDPASVRIGDIDPRSIRFASRLRRPSCAWQS